MLSQPWFVIILKYIYFINYYIDCSKAVTTITSATSATLYKNVSENYLNSIYSDEEDEICESWISKKLLLGVPITFYVFFSITFHMSISYDTFCNTPYILLRILFLNIFYE